ncbi:MAG: tripartite tricarboxylate transporter substrate binding protein, partial [Smithellaceae bacterium]|nr:tripartite tricarboxylate transporter substrate binding protein [Smithellaceae bacterium]
LFLLGIFISGVMVIGSWGVASAYPERQIEIIVPFGVGGGADTAARVMAEGMKPLLKTPVVVTNMPGGGGTRGMLHVAGLAADGYTLLFVTTSHLIDAVKPKTRAHIMRDFDFLMRLQHDTTVVVISGDSKYKTLAELIEYGKKNPRFLKFAGTSPGAWSEIGTVSFFKKLGVEVTFVPFESGAEIKAAILGGHIHGALEEVAESLPLIQAGKLKALATIMEKRHPALPDVPSTVELGIDYTHGLFRGLAVKKGTPPDRAKFLHDTIKKALDSPVYKKFLADTLLDVRPGYLGPEAATKFAEAQLGFFAEVLKDLGYVK